MENAENRLEKAQNREILNYALVGTQVVMMIQRFGQLALATTQDTVATAANATAKMGLAKANLAVLMSNPVTWAFAAVAGAALIGLMANDRAVQSNTAAEQGRIAGIPTGHSGASIQETGNIVARKGEFLLTPDQMSSIGGGISVSIGGDVFNINSIDDIDALMDRKKSDVKSELRRLTR